ncbi:MAG: EamA family transporter [Paludibacteraceae bacterium]|nr:EamA family transporter [Paludibacteraceae bacterium]MBQ7747609.1 EamA family transporter [Paludibacteraceae bacterium]
MWIVVIFIAAVFLGLYDVFQKISLRGNALMPVLFFSIVTSAVVLTPFLLLSRLAPSQLSSTPFYVADIDFRTHCFILIKSLIVLASWIFGYAGMKHLPLTVVSPVKAIQPVWTVIGAFIIFSERLNLYQGLGVAFAILCFYIFSLIGKREEQGSVNNKWIICLVISTLIGASSGLYDKFLMKGFDRMAVQVYFTYYQVLLMGVLLFFIWWPHRKEYQFSWRWSIPLIGLFLSCSDFLYFYALSLPDSLISIISPLRRTSFVIPFVYGAVVYHERNISRKLLCLVLLAVGMTLIYMGSSL